MNNLTATSNPTRSGRCLCKGSHVETEGKVSSGLWTEAVWLILFSDHMMFILPFCLVLDSTSDCDSTGNNTIKAEDPKNLPKAALKSGNCEDLTIRLTLSLQGPLSLCWCRHCHPDRDPSHLDRNVSVEAKGDHSEQSICSDHWFAWTCQKERVYSMFIDKPSGDPATLATKMSEVIYDSIIFGDICLCFSCLFFPLSMRDSLKHPKCQMWVCGWQGGAKCRTRGSGA